MNNLEIDSLQELTSTELNNINGGCGPNPGVYMRNYFSSLWSDFVEGFNDGSGANC